MTSKNESRKIAAVTTLSDDVLAHVAGGHAAVKVPSAAAEKVFELVATGKSHGLTAAMLK